MRFGRIARNLSATVLLCTGLGLWVTLPWYGALVAAATLGLWLFLTRTGRLALAATGVGIVSLPQRWGASSVVVVGIACVVGVLVAMLAMGEGFKATLNGTGSDDTAILLRGGSQVETNSIITRDQLPLIINLPGIAQDGGDRALASPELSQVVSLPGTDGTDASVQMRGVGEEAWAVRPHIRLVEGRKFEPGLREIVVGRGLFGQHRGVEVGKPLRLGNEEWSVVGVFASGDAHDSEMWTDTQTLASAYRRPFYQSVIVRLDGRDGLERLKKALADDPRLRLDALTTSDYYTRQSSGLTAAIGVLGTVIGVIMAVGAVFGALNAMYAAVAIRAREIATLRAIGFRGVPVVVAVMLETMLLALLGGLLGGLVTWVVFNGHGVSTMSDFSQVMFEFKVSPELLWTGLKWALGIGLIGGLYPALRAARLPITTALRAV